MIEVTRRTTGLPSHYNTSTEHDTDTLISQPTLSTVCYSLKTAANLARDGQHVNSEGSFVSWGSTFPCDWTCTPCAYLQDLSVRTVGVAAKTAAVDKDRGPRTATENAAKIAGGVP